MNLRLTKWEWLFVVAAGLIAVIGVLYPASIYGAGVSSDSAFYLSTADSFAAGAGFTDFKGDPLIDFPPLYSLVLGVMHWMSGISSFTLGLIFNAGAMALLVVSTGLILLRCFPARRLWFYLGVLLTLVFLPLYTLGAMIATDLFYILLTLWFCLAAQSLFDLSIRRSGATEESRILAPSGLEVTASLPGQRSVRDFLDKKRLFWLTAMTILAAACALLRWIGLAVVVSEFILVFIAYRSDLKKAFLYAALSSGLAFLPAALWIGVHNIWLSGTWGRAGVIPGMVDVLGNLRLTGERMLAWTAPDPTTTFLPVVIVFLLAVLVLNRAQDYKRWLSRLIHNPIMPVILTVLVYFIAVTLTGYTGDHLETFDDRYQAPLYYFILIILFASLEELIFSHLKGHFYSAVMLLVIAVLGVWGVYRADLLVTFARTSRGQGVVAYNIYNTQKLMESGLVGFLKENPLPQDITVYTNESEALYFLLHRQVKMAPFDSTNYYANTAVLKSLYPRWPAEEEAYLVWVKPNAKRHHYSPRQLKQLAKMEPLFIARDGEVYLVKPKK